LKRYLIIPALLAAAICHANPTISATDALRLASQNRPALQAARLSVEQARLSARVLSAFPPLSLSLGASTRSEVGATDQDLALSQSLDLFGRTRSLERLGAADVLAALAVYRNEASRLQSEVLTAFAETATAGRQSQVARDLLLVSEGLLTVTQRKFDEGKVAEVQVTRAMIERERARQASALKSADFQAALTRLASVLAVPVQDLSIDPAAPLEALVQTNPMDRPAIMSLQAEAVKAKAEAEAVRASSLPEFSLQLVRSPWSNDPGIFVGRAQFTWAVWDHGRARNEIESANTRAESVQMALEDALLQGHMELAAVQIELDSRQARINSYDQILAATKDLVEKSQMGFVEGFSTQVEVLEATRALREVEQDLVEAKHQLNLAVIKQYEAAGFLAEVLQ
jgi:outer membrane protein TolC